MTVLPNRPATVTGCGVKFDDLEARGLCQGTSAGKPIQVQDTATGLAGIAVAKHFAILNKGSAKICVAIGVWFDRGTSNV